MVTNVERVSLKRREQSVVTFRPTVVQSAAHGGVVGWWVGTGVSLVIAVTATIAELDVSAWLVVVGPPLVGFAIGSLTGATLGRDGAVQIDDMGIRLVPGPANPVARWPRVADVRPERRRGRTYVAVYLETGEIVMLYAPYDGRLLAGDPQFERKLFMLRNLWETHRSSPTVPMDS